MRCDRKGRLAVRLLLSMFSFGLIALGLGLICDPAVIAAHVQKVGQVWSAPTNPPPPPGRIQIQLVGAERFAAGAFGPLELPPATCPRDPTSSVTVQAMRSF